jgi:hypothetical protein
VSWLAFPTPQASSSQSKKQAERQAKIIFDLASVSSFNTLAKFVWLIAAVEQGPSIGFEGKNGGQILYSFSCTVQYYVQHV